MQTMKRLSRMMDQGQVVVQALWYKEPADEMRPIKEFGKKHESPLCGGPYRFA